MYKDDISQDQYEEYVELLASAETAVLQEAEVILCTCVTSGQLRITSATNIQQVLNSC